MKSAYAIIIAIIVMMMSTAMSANAGPGITREMISTPEQNARMTPAEKAAEVPLGEFVEVLEKVLSKGNGKPVPRTDDGKISFANMIAAVDELTAKYAKEALTATPERRNELAKWPTTAKQTKSTLITIRTYWRKMDDEMKKACSKLLDAGVTRQPDGSVKYNSRDAEEAVERIAEQRRDEKLNLLAE